MKATRHLKSMITTVITLSALVLGACVSVDIGPKSGERSKGVEFRAPASPYSELESDRADGAWQNKSSGNSISYFSTCNDPADPSLETVSRELFAELLEMKVIRQDNFPFNGREALDMEVEGKVDGVLTHVRAVIFKKNGCTYTLSHIGATKSGFDTDRPIFSDFVRSFQAP